MENDIYDLAVIGGGAAGFFGAIACAETRAGQRICILEKGSALLGKVRVSGGGRCNVTHACYDPAKLVSFYPRGGKALRGPFTRFQPRDTVAWFESRGAALKTEADGRIFPVSDSSETIVNLLVETARHHGIEIRTRAPVAQLGKQGECFRIQFRDGSVLQARSVLLATGGDRAALELAAGLGHGIVPPVPSLFTFTISDPRLDGLAGISVPEVRLKLEDGERAIEQSGALLVTHWGLSGPAVLRLSAWGARPLHEAGYRAHLEVSWLPDLNQAEIHTCLLDVKADSRRRKAAGHDPFGRLPQRLWERLALHAGMRAEQTWGDTSREQLLRLSGELARGRYHIQGKGEFKEEFVTCGGIRLSEVDFRDMQSKVCPGLYLAGEALDIDGITGGFNFQSAWTTAWLAGRAVGISG